MVNPFGLPPEEAVKFFQQKGFAFSFDWRDVYGKAHARAFTVAKATQLDVLADLRFAVDKAIRTGGTLGEFKKGLRPLLQQKGWWGEKEVIDPKDGVSKLVQLGSPARLRTIYETNLRQAMAAGREEKFERVKDRRPYARYVCILDGRERAEHKAWHGTVLPLDHPWWEQHTPPNGWGCRCKKQQLSERDLVRYGYNVSAEPPPTEYRVWTNERTGETTRVPKGIDPGFDYNPGKAPRGYVAPKSSDNAEVLDDVENFKSLGLPTTKERVAAGGLPVAVDQWHDLMGLADADKRWVSLFGKGVGEVTDPTGDQVTFNPRYLDHLYKTEGLSRVRAVPRAKQTVEQPAEVWLVPYRRADGSVVMRKRYIGMFDGREKNYCVVVERTDEGNVAWTTYMNSRTDAKREGYLLYPRPKPAPPPEPKSFAVDEKAASEQLDRIGRDRVELRMVPIEKIRVSDEWSSGKAQAMKSAIASGAPFPPVRLLGSDRTGFGISDGIHRIAAARAAGHTHVPALVPKQRGRR